MRGVHGFTGMLGASGTSGHGFWVFLAACIVGFAAVAYWAVRRLRAEGYLDRARPTIEVFPDLYADEDELPEAA